MLECDLKEFTNNERAFIVPLINLFNYRFNNDIHGSIIDRVSFVRFEFFIGEPINNNTLVLQFKVKDQENIHEGFCNFVHISNILIPPAYRRQGIANSILAVMALVAHTKVGIDFFITEIVNDPWKDYLLSIGGLEDAAGDIQIDYNVFLVN